MNKTLWNKYMDDVGVNHSELGGADLKKYDVAPIVKDVFLASNIDEKIKKVLCIGCGFGQEVMLFKEKGYEATGITYCKEDIKNAKKILELNILEADMHDLPIEDNSFDLVFVRQVFEHSLSPYIVLSEISRVTKNGFYVVIFLPHIYEWSMHDRHIMIPTKYQLECLALKFNLILSDHLIDISSVHRKWNSYVYIFKKEEKIK